MIAMERSLPIFVFLIFFVSSSLTEAQTFDVTSSKYGGKADGASDLTSALQAAWADACATPSPSQIVIPKGAFVMNKIALGGPCKSSMSIRLDGTIKAPADPSQMKGDGWILIHSINDFTLTGSGTLDGQGKVAWSKNDCAAKKICTQLPTTLRFDFVTNALVEGITSLDSKFFHINVLGCRNITFQNMKITAPGDSTNTDGIHIGRSNGVYITNTVIQTGDDCVSIGDGSNQVHVTGVSCGPGHGISVGSLGKWPNEEPVVGIFVKNCTLSGTTNGVRIKTWPNSPPGTATDMHFEDIVMTSVTNPILIDQGYCPWNQCNTGSPSKVKLSNVSFKNIRGTSATQSMVQLSCSKSFPCEGVEFADVNLTFDGVKLMDTSDAKPASLCENISPSITGTMNPPLCKAADATAGGGAAVGGGSGGGGAV